MDVRDAIASGAGHTLSRIHVHLMSDVEIAGASGGLVKKPETVNYRTFAPERDGLFCEEIFGAVRACGCGREPKKEMYTRDMRTGRVCSACKQRAPLPPARRRRFGHIALAAPVVHPWFADRLAQRVGLSEEDYRAVERYEKFVVVADGLSRPKGSVVDEGTFMDLLDAGAPPDSMHYGAEAIQHRIGAAHPAILRAIPVLPPHLRPLVPLDGGRYATSDVNDLYRRVINRNNRTARLIELNAPEIIIRNEKRMLQEAVNSLFDNEHGTPSVTGPNRRPLRSIAFRAGDPRSLGITLANLDAAIAGGEASLERPKRLHRRIAALRAAGIALEPMGH